ncbi:MAG: thaumatin family protein [Gammaproteobacteria bacterium]
MHSASIAVSVGGPPPETYRYGKIQIGAFPSARQPSATDFTMTAQLGQIVTLQANLADFDQSLDGIPVFLQTTAGAFVGNPQCEVDSGLDAKHTCLYTLQLPTAPPAGGTITVTARVVGNPSAFQAWNTPTVTISATPAPVAGSIVLESLDGSAPRGMSTPVWAVLRDSSGIGDTVVALNPTGTSVEINPGVSRTSGAYQKRSCTLSSASPVCGFGVKGIAAGRVSIGATAPSGDYSIEPLFLVVTEPLTAARLLSFRNRSPAPVWLGVTSGTSNSYQTRALVSASDPLTQAPNKMCGPSNPPGACPRGASCQQGGAYPDKDTTYFCYWDQPVPSNGYEIATSSSEETTVRISDSSYDPVADIVWSGNFFPREGCTLSASGELRCAIASCGNAASGQACAPGTGGAPAVATLPEVTLQRLGTDYYDISIIGGANVMTSFGPDRSSLLAPATIPESDAYWCGTAGAGTESGEILPASDWDLGTHVEDLFVAGATMPYSHTAQTAATKSSAYYQFVSTVSPREAPACTSSSQCSTSGYACGYDSAAVDHGADSDYKTSCGRPLAWVPANQIWAMNASPSNVAPFRFQGTLPTASAGTIQLNQLFSCTAPTASGYDTANTDATRSCGCTNWGEASLPAVAGDAPFTSAVAAPSAPCASNNAVGGQHPWTTNVLPSIAWLKKACPTCYTYPFDDMSSTFQCTNSARSETGTNSVPYAITFGGHIPGR